MAKTQIISFWNMHSLEINIAQSNKATSIQQLVFITVMATFTTETFLLIPPPSYLHGCCKYCKYKQKNDFKSHDDGYLRALKFVRITQANLRHSYARSFRLDSCGFFDVFSILTLQGVICNVFSTMMRFLTFFRPAPLHLKLNN